jgi:hypothetical protein
MFTLILGMAVAGGLVASPQAQPPVFRAEVYVVPLQIMVFEGRNWACGSKPDIRLSITDFTLTLDKKIYAPADVTQDPDRPGRYLLNVAMPEKYRDGRVHRIEVRIQRRGRATWPLRIPTPSVGPTQPSQGIAVCCGTACLSK